jgi:transcriptional regulator with XRE-family HTH domain
MTNTELFKQKVKNSGLKYTYLAKKLGLSREGLSKKINNETEFKASEISILCAELKIVTPKEKDSIFFAAHSELNSTKEA